MALVPPYTYAAIAAEKSGRYDIRFDVDVGFGLWRRGVMMRIAGAGATKTVAEVVPGQRLVIATERSYGRYIARVQPEDVKPAYSYAAVLLPGHDGDNVLVNADLGFEFWWRRMSVRLEGCNARELAEPGGPEAREHIAAIAPAGTSVLLRSMKNDKYGGRYTGAVIMPGGANLAETLIATQWAARWDGRGVKPVPPWPRTA